MERPYRNLTSVILGVVAFAVGYMFLFPTGCNEPEGVSSWKRCSTVMGNPAFSLTDWGLDNTFDILIPLVVGVGAGLVTRWFLDRRSAEPTY